MILSLKVEFLKIGFIISEGCSIMKNIFMVDFDENRRINETIVIY